jgi:hypothetical protein
MAALCLLMPESPENFFTSWTAPGFLVPFTPTIVIKNKKSGNEFENYKVASISKALIPPCGVLDR